MSYKFLKTLGEGQYGAVYKAVVVSPTAGTTWNRDHPLVSPTIEEDQVVAVKKFFNKENNDLQVFLREITSLLYVNSDYVVRALDTFIHKDHFYIILEYYHTNLYNYISDNSIPINTKIQIFTDIENGLKDLHQAGFLHRDLVPMNILIKADRAVIADLGMSTSLGRKSMTPGICTLWHRAPEVLCPKSPNGRKYKYDEKSDIWALGCMAYFIAKENPLFPESTEISMISKMCATFGTSNFLQYYLPPYTPRIYSDDSDRKLNTRQDFFDEKIYQYLKLDPEERASLVDDDHQSRGASEYIATTICTVGVEKIISEKFRNIVVEWMLEVEVEYHLSYDTIINAVKMFDIYIEKFPTDCSKAQLLAIVCMILSAKYFEIYVPKYDEWEYICDKAYSVQEIEQEILLVLEKFKCRVWYSSLDHRNDRDYVVKMCMDRFDENI